MPDPSASSPPVHPVHGHRGGHSSSAATGHRHDGGDSSPNVDSSAVPAADDGGLDETDLDDDAATPLDASPAEAAPGTALSQRVTQLEEWVLELRVQVGELA